MGDHERNGILLTDEVRELVALMKDSDIAEVLIERGDAKLHLKRTTPAAPAQVSVPVYSTPPLAAVQSVVAPAVPGMASVSTQPDAVEAEQPPGVTVTAPMVGTYYGSPSPKDPPYVRVGDEVRPGDVLGIIEAMKIMNEIECEVHGRVAQVLVQNSQPVEYGQTLMVIEPL